MWLAASGAAALVVVAASNPRAVLAFLRRRDARRGADAALATVFFAAILVVVQATSVNRSRVFDLTRNQRNTLAPQTTALLDSLGRDVNVTGFFRQASPRRDGANTLLALYANRSPRFRYTLVDPDRRPDDARRLGARVDEMVVETDSDRRVVRNIDEQSLTGALISLTRRGPRVAYFVTGHGEKDIGNGDREGFSAARSRLESQAYDARPLSLLGGARVPSDCSVLIVAGPRHDYFADEVASIHRYLDAGGSVLFMIDARVDVPLLATVLARYHLGLVDAIVLDEVALDSGDRSFDATVAKVRRYESHAITRGFNWLTLFPRARPVIVRGDSSRADATANYLAITDDGSWGETDESAFSTGRATRDGVDVAGPLPIAAVATRTPFVTASGAPATGATSRVVLVGDSDFANNAMLGVLGNADFFMNCVAYLSDDADLIRIRPRRALNESVYITERQGRMVFLVCIVLLPLAPVVAGAVVLAQRRRA
jgi:ABC-type uncharacterized transport system involved in gliding motility auxiliary subunit